MKLKAKDLPAYREAQLQKQNGMDPIILKPITEPCLDHDHSTGVCRMVLQREINAFEGKVWRAYKRYVRHLGVSLSTVLAGLMWYHQRDFSANPLHPTHRDAEEKRVLRNKRAKRARNRKKKENK